MFFFVGWILNNLCSIFIFILYIFKNEKKFLQKVFKEVDGNENNFFLVQELLIKYNCIEDTLIRANHFAEVAIDSLSIFPDNEYKKALIKLIKTSVNRLN